MFIRNDIAGEVQNMRIHAGILVNTDSGQTYSKVR